MKIATMFRKIHDTIDLSLLVMMYSIWPGFVALVIALYVHGNMGLEAFFSALCFIIVYSIVWIIQLKEVLVK